VNRFAYYESMKQLAREVRERFGFDSPRVTRSDLRAIYRAEQIHIDLWPHKLRKLRGAYFRDEAGCTVMLAKGLPEEPMVFTMSHELKHHFADRDLAVSYCDISNEQSYIEIGAEVFAAELIFPETAFVQAAMSLNVTQGRVDPAAVIRLKRETRTTLSYAGIVKRLEFLGFIAPGAFATVRWKKLEEEVYGEPLYKQLLRRRAAMTRGLR
jgi:Zn-dependent peptidase ImmA (M78 family)